MRKPILLVAILASSVSVAHARNFDSLGRVIPGEQPITAKCEALQELTRPDSRVLLVRMDTEELRTRTESQRWSLKVWSKQKKDLTPMEAGAALMDFEIIPPEDVIERTGYFAYLKDAGCKEERVMDKRGFKVDFKTQEQACVKRATALYLLKKWGLGKAALSELDQSKNLPFVDFYQVCLKLNEASALEKTLEKLVYALKSILTGAPEETQKESDQVQKPATPVRPTAWDREYPLGSMIAPAK